VHRDRQIAVLFAVALTAGLTLLPTTVAAADGEPDINTLQLASPDVALTFARIRDGRARTVIAVTKYDGGIVEGVDLSIALARHINDPIITFLDQGYDKLRDLLVDAAPQARVSVPVRSLVLPIDLLDRHIAAGTNFPAHAGEAGVDGGPFLFAKHVRPTGPYAEVATREGLLDYEVELAWLLLEEVERGQSPDWMGLLLCNDYTDRETLLQHINVADVGSGDGFTTGKSFDGYLPIGSLFVIPRDYRAFAAELELSLWVNDELRQSSPVAAALWGIDELIQQTWRRQALRWKHGDREVALLNARDTINARTLMMGGTPEGTIFAGITTGQKIRGAASWLFGGWDKSLPDNVIDVYRADAHADGRYLQPGDTVTIRVEKMGVIQNTIVR
jgi:2-keto-4-pentenoate hydratase/2-oxohepta-3-ene-1,7-dioic acid hydratase in catechol pathway